MKQQVTGTVEKIVAGGFGIIRTDQGVVFAQGVLPGESVEFSIESGSGGTKWARNILIQTPSPQREEGPRCDYFGVCGGCDLMHIQSRHQIGIKTAILRDSLLRVGKWPKEDLPEIQTWSGSAFRYRTRVQFHLVNGALGFRERGGKTVLPIKACEVASQEIQDRLEYHRQTGNGVIEFSENNPESEFLLQIVDSQAGGGCLEGLLHQNQPGKRSEESGAAALRTRGILAPRTGSVDILGRGLDADAAGFFQSNHQGLEAMLRVIQELLADREGISSALELYCGIGVIGTMLPESITDMLGVEIDTETVAMARGNLEPRGRVVRKSVKNFCLSPEGREALNRRDLLVADPSRRGLDKSLMNTLAEIQSPPPYALLVFCDPVSAARDIAGMRKLGYRIEHLQLFDFYPQTSHFETLAFLSRRQE
ncbi:class I SAM-dependent RNA methyltransferase [Spirochaeta lutea]|uniref:TRAM domain-containing protein n=1 Tax=Spirochaeta lutea TaxID=1480694 RepID=A0A098R0F7_9SPIO|nr:class I SAM-dependent RNA methyltransferase [Spirochaeta lutea]KGE73650.1 hypothetical protein DC28_03180 [Spirochaeta lutea]